MEKKEKGEKKYNGKNDCFLPGGFWQAPKTPEDQTLQFIFIGNILKKHGECIKNEIESDAEKDNYMSFALMPGGKTIN